MLYFVYQRLLIVLEWIGKLWRFLERIERQIARLQRTEDANAAKLDANAATLAELQDAVAKLAGTFNPEPAVSVKLIAGAIAEQP
jgi:hypothetical protein